MTEQTEKEVLKFLKAIQIGQGEIIEQLQAQRELAEEQLRFSQKQLIESIKLQREALKRQRSIILIAAPGILICIVALAYLVLRYI